MSKFEREDGLAYDHLSNSTNDVPKYYERISRTLLTTKLRLE